MYDKIHKLFDFANSIKIEELNEYQELIEYQKQYTNDYDGYVELVYYKMSKWNEQIMHHLVSLCNIIHEVELANYNFDMGEEEIKLLHIQNEEKQK